MRASLALLTSIALAVPALADPATGLFEWQVSADGGTTWSYAITVNPGDAYKVRAQASWTTIPGTTDIGFGGVTFEQIDLIGADAADVFGGASGPGGVPTYLTRRQAVPENWTLQTGTGASAGALKLDNIVTTPAHLTRVNLNQLPYRVGGSEFPNPHFTRDNPLMVFEMAAAASSPKVLTISATWTRLGTPLSSNEFKVYITESGASKKPIQEAGMSPAHVWIRPNASCVPDFNRDGLVDFSDYLEFLSFYDADDFRADLNRDGFVDFADYLEFLTAFDAGC